MAHLSLLSPHSNRPRLTTSSLGHPLAPLPALPTTKTQTRAARPIPTIQLSVVITAVATAGLVAFIAVPAALRKAAALALAAWRARREVGHEQQQQQPSSPRKQAAATADDAAAATAARAAARRRLLVSAGVATGIGALVALQALTLIYASRLVFAFLVQLVMLLTPLVTAVASRWLLKQPTPRGLWAALAAAVAGSALVITGNYLGAAGAAKAAGAAGAAASAAAARDMAAGLALAFVSMLLLSAYLVSLQATQHLTSGEAVMWSNMFVALVALTPLAFAVEGADWGWVHALSATDWLVMFFAGFFVDALNTLWTQAASRVLGAAVISLFIAMRLVSSVAGSAALLGELPRSPLVWAGFGVVIASMTAFMAVQARDKAAKARREAAQQEEQGDEEKGAVGDVAVAAACASLTRASWASAFEPRGDEAPVAPQGSGIWAVPSLQQQQQQPQQQLKTPPADPLA